MSEPFTCQPHHGVYCDYADGLLSGFKKAKELMEKAHQESLMWERNAVAAQARDATAVYELEETQAELERMKEVATKYCDQLAKEQAHTFRLEKDNKVKQTIIDGYNLDMLMDVFKNELEKQIRLTLDVAARQCYQIASSHEFGPDAAKTIRETFGLEI